MRRVLYVCAAVKIYSRAITLRAVCVHYTLIAELERERKRERGFESILEFVFRRDEKLQSFAQGERSFFFPILKNIYKMLE